MTNCSSCGKKLLIKKDSEYVICSHCRSTIVIDKDLCQELEDSIDLSPEELYLLLENGNNYNPYLIPENLYNFIKENYEKLLKERKKEKYDEKILYYIVEMNICFMLLNKMK